MKETMKRYGSAWLLLAVFLPMLLMASLHVHPTVHQEEEICVECVHHQHHSGHIGSLNVAAFDCVLCQFLSLPFLAAQVVVFIAVAHRHLAPVVMKRQAVVDRTRGFVFLRAPPVLL